MLLLQFQSLDVNDLTAELVVATRGVQRISVQMSDLGGEMSTGVVSLEVGIDEDNWNGMSGSKHGANVTFTSTTSTHLQKDIAVEDVSHVRLRPTTANGSNGTVYFTVFGYNIED